MGFSLNANVKGEDVSLCKGFRPSAVFGQSLQTTFSRIQLKLESSALLVAEHRAKFEKSGLFAASRTGNEMILNLQSKLSTEKISLVNELLLDLSNDVKKFGSTEQQRQASHP
jgi:hypothetical protein